MSQKHKQMQAIPQTTVLQLVVSPYESYVIVLQTFYLTANHGLCTTSMAWTWARKLEQIRAAVMHEMPGMNSSPSSGKISTPGPEELYTLKQPARARTVQMKILIGKQLFDCVQLWFRRQEVQVFMELYITLIVKHSIGIPRHCMATSKCCRRLFTMTLFEKQVMSVLASFESSGKVKFGLTWPV